MSLEDLSAAVQSNYSDIGDEETVSLDRESRNELALLAAALEPEDVDELVRRGVHLLFRQTVETGNLDFHLRSGYDVTYDEYLSGMTYDEMTGNAVGSSTGDPDDRRYQF